EFVIIIEGMCRDGTALDPIIILKAEDFVIEWFRRVKGVPENILFGKSHNRWTDETMAMKYLKQNFEPISQSASKTNEKYYLLLFNRHSSHVNSQFLDY
ncbi:hypothetical protein L873DRAFT_1698382, partial [Choiromyces venosus 120613-1]